MILFYFVYVYVKDRFSQIDENTEKIMKLEDKINYIRQLNEIDKRVTLLEKTGKRKGNIDPRIIFVIVLLILLYLYLKSVGVL